MRTHPTLLSVGTSRYLGCRLTTVSMKLLKRLVVGVAGLRPRHRRLCPLTNSGSRKEALGSLCSLVVAPAPVLLRNYCRFRLRLIFSLPALERKAHESVAN